MADGKSPSDDDLKPRRPAPTLDLTATEVPGESGPAPSAGADPAAAPGEAATGPIDPSADLPPQPEAGPIPGPASESEAPPSRPADRASPIPARLLLGAFGAGVGGALLTMLALWAAGIIPGLHAEQPPSPDPRLAAIEVRLRELANRPSLQPAADPKPLADLAARLTKAETALAAPRPAAAPPELKALTDQAGALGRRVDDIALESREARSRAETAAAGLADLQTAARANAADRAAIEALAKRVTGLETTDRAVAEQLAKRSAEAAEAGAVKLALVAGALRNAVERGEPYASELAAMRALGNAAALAPLEPFAASGVPSVALLGRELTALLPAMRALAGTPQQAGGFLERLQNNAERLVRVRPVDAPAGDDAAAVLARVESRAAQSDIGGSLAELAKLTAEVRAPAQAWMTRAEARSRAIESGRRTAQDALAALRPAP